MRRLLPVLLLPALLLIATAASATSPRDLLTGVVYSSAPRARIVAGIDEAHRAATNILDKLPTDHEALLVRALADGYRAKLTRSRTDAVRARIAFETLVHRNPADAEAQVALGGWHLDAVAGLGGFLARTILGADRATGYAALDRAVALGGNRALFAGFAALLRLQISGDDPRARALAEAGARGSTPTALDAQMQRAAIAVLVPLRKGDGAAAHRLAPSLLPLGRMTP